MRKTTNYFSHDSNARNDEKIIRLRMKHGAEGYGVYFMLLERLREEASYKSAKDYAMIAYDLRVDEALVESVVERFGLFEFTDDGEFFYSNSFNRRMCAKESVSKARSEAAKIRWNESNEDANAYQEGCKCNANAYIIKERKEPKERIKQSKQSKENDFVVKESADDAFLCKFLSSNNALIESVLMGMNMKPEDRPLFYKTARIVVDEWKLREAEHTDYKDWAAHLISTIRIKLNERRKNNGNKNTADDRASDVAELVERMLAKDGAD